LVFITLCECFLGIPQLPPLAIFLHGGDAGDSRVEGRRRSLLQDPRRPGRPVHPCPPSIKCGGLDEQVVLPCHNRPAHQQSRATRVAFR
jgi:hypothetical protein